MWGGNLMDSNLFWCIVGIIGGAIFSLFISLFFYLIGKKKKKITYSIETVCLMLNEVNLIDELEIKYNTHKIKSLYSSSIVIRNTGNSIIDKNDFALSNPLSFITNGEFLINSKNQSSLFTSNRNDSLAVNLIEEDGVIKKIDIKFDYISKKEAITFTIAHTDDIFFNGKLKEGKIIKLNELFDIDFLMDKYSHYLFIVVALISGSFCLFYCINNIFDIFAYPSIHFAVAITLLGIIGFIISRPRK